MVVDDEKIGLQRKDLYVDARDLQQKSNDVTLTDAQYKEALINRGINKLAERKKIININWRSAH